MAPQQPHFLLVAFPVQGHINPSLQLAKRLLRIGARVTLSTCVSAQRYITRTVVPEGLFVTTFSDGYDDDRESKEDFALYMTELRRRSSQSIHDLILHNESEGDPFTCIVYTLIPPWLAEIRRCLDLVMVDGSEMSENAKKWRDLAREAVAEGGSSDINLREFYESISNSNGCH